MLNNKSVKWWTKYYNFKEKRLHEEHKEFNARLHPSKTIEVLREPKNFEYFKKDNKKLLTKDEYLQACEMYKRAKRILTKLFKHKIKNSEDINHDKIYKMLFDGDLPNFEYYPYYGNLIGKINLLYTEKESSLGSIYIEVFTDGFLYFVDYDFGIIDKNNNSYGKFTLNMGLTLVEIKQKRAKNGVILYKHKCKQM